MEDFQFHYSFDATNTPALGIAIAAGGFTNDIPLTLEADAAFICRAIKIELEISASNLYAQLRTPHGDFMARPYIPFSVWSYGAGIQPAGFLFVPLPEEIECPPGSNWTLDLYNPTSGSVNPPAVTLLGVKRWISKRAEARWAA